jgi:hypothetical protein
MKVTAGWNYLAVTNTLAYLLTITTVKSFVVQAGVGVIVINLTLGWK